MDIDTPPTRNHCIDRTLARAPLRISYLSVLWRRRFLQWSQISLRCSRSEISMRLFWLKFSTEIFTKLIGDVSHELIVTKVQELEVVPLLKRLGCQGQ